MQTRPRLLSRGWPERTKLYPDISNVLSSGELLELRYVSERKIMSNLRNARYAVKRDNLA